MKSDEYKILEDTKKEKSVEDSKIRWKDPECWKCLTNEQRDIINEWYLECEIESQKSTDRKLEVASNAGFFALAPISFALALLGQKTLNLRFLFSSFSTFIILALVYYISTRSYTYFFVQKSSGITSVLKHFIAIFLSFFVIYIVLSQCNLIS